MFKIENKRVVLLCCIFLVHSVLKRWNILFMDDKKFDADEIACSTRQGLLLVVLYSFLQLRDYLWVVFSIYPSQIYNKYRWFELSIQQI